MCYVLAPKGSRRLRAKLRRKTSCKHAVVGRACAIDLLALVDLNVKERKRKNIIPNSGYTHTHIVRDSVETGLADA